MTGCCCLRLNGGNIAVDALGIVMKYLEPLDLLMCAGVDRTWNVASSQNVLWQTICDQRINVLSSIINMPVSATNKARFLATLINFKHVRAEQMRAQQNGWRQYLLPTRVGDMPERLLPQLVGLPTKNNEIQALEHHPDSKAFLSPILTWQMHHVFRAYIVRSLVMYTCVHVLSTFVTTDHLALLMAVLMVLWHGSLYRCYTFDVLPTAGNLAAEYINSFLSKVPPQMAALLPQFVNGNNYLESNWLGGSFKTFNQATWSMYIHKHIQQLTTAFEGVTLDASSRVHVFSKSRILCVLAHVALLVEFQTLVALPVFFVCIYNMFRDIYRIITTPSRVICFSQLPPQSEYHGDEYDRGAEFVPKSTRMNHELYAQKEHDVCGNDVLGVLLQRYGGFHTIPTVERTYLTRRGWVHVLCVNSLLPSCILYTAKYIGAPTFLGWPFLLCCLYWIIVVLARLHPITTRRQGSLM